VFVSIGTVSLKGEKQPSICIECTQTQRETRGNQQKGQPWREAPTSRTKGENAHFRRHRGTTKKGNKRLSSLICNASRTTARAVQDIRGKENEEKNLTPGDTLWGHMAPLNAREEGPKERGGLKRLSRASRNNGKRTSNFGKC